jgi:hypothetical protein
MLLATLISLSVLALSALALPQPQQQQQPDLDVILFGATGCVGHLAAHYLAKQPQLKWGISDYNATRLQDLATSLHGLPSGSPELFVADLSPTVDLSFLSRTKAVATAAGPFSKYGGEYLVRACAAYGVGYADISDEFFWQREMVDKYDRMARVSGAKIVLAAGFCALVGDLGSQLAIRELGGATPGQATASVDAWLEGYSGGLSAGVIAGQIADRNASFPKAWNDDPYVLAPNASAALKVDSKVEGMSYPTEVRGEGLIIANLFGPYDARLLRRTFTQRQQRVRLRVGATPEMYAKWSAFVALHPKGWSSLAKCPTAEVLTDGSWSYRFRAQKSHASGLPGSDAALAPTSVEVLLEGSGDPGYNFTSASLAEAALCLAGRTPGCLRADFAGGVVTSMVALDPLVVRQRYERMKLLTATTTTAAADL